MIKKKDGGPGQDPGPRTKCVRLFARHLKDEGEYYCDDC